MMHKSSIQKTMLVSIVSVAVGIAIGTSVYVVCSASNKGEQRFSKARYGDRIVLEMSESEIIDALGCEAGDYRTNDGHSPYNHQIIAETGHLTHVWAKEEQLKSWLGDHGALLCVFEAGKLRYYLFIDSKQ